MYIIPQKMSNSGSIYDISSDQMERVILFKGCQYSVVLPSYYGGKGYTTHKLQSAVIKQYLKMKHYNPVIIDKEGNRYYIPFNGAEYLVKEV